MVTANMHSIATVRAKRGGDTTWLEVEDRNGNNVALFMPFAAALMMQKAFEASSASHATQEPLA